MFNLIRVILRHQDLQVYGVILPAELTNQDMLDSKAYKEYYAVASGAEPPKAKIKYKKKADESVTSPKSKTASASKGTRLKSKAKVIKRALKKQPTKNTKEKDFHMSQASGSGDGFNTQSKVPDEQQQKTSGTDEETGTVPGVPNVPPYEFESDKESWGDSDDEDDDCENSYF
nr:hypothetical protein [Tanacetum cinerariifolium]